MDQKKLREQENRCIQEQAPACVAACPVHVDARGLAALIARGEFTQAFALYRKTIPFPDIISRICDQPCKAVCLRIELGGSIELAALERACVAFGSQDPESIKALPRKNKKLAIVGAGLSGLTAAYDLARKGWGVEIFEAEDRIGGGLWMTAADFLPRDVLIQDLQIIEDLGVVIHLNASVCRTGGNGHATTITRLSEEFDALLLSCGSHTNDVRDLKLDEGGKIEVNPITFQTSMPKVFASGDILRTLGDFPETGVQHSAILSISQGRRAATSIDRFLQNVSLTASRVNEGAYTSRLYTNISKIPVEKPLIPTDSSTSYNPEVAETEAARCIQCECMECVKVCPYLKHYQGYPKKYIREIYNNLSIVMGTRYSNQFINTCAVCGLCAEVCPEDLDMGLICHDARIQMVEQKRMPASAHDFALQDMAFSNGPKFSLARNAPGMTASEVAFFPGCQLSASNPESVEKMFDFLGSVYGTQKVGLMLRCCGAPADWAGQQDLFEASKTALMQDHAQLGNPKLIIACSSCYQMFKTHFPDIELLSFWEVYDQHGPQEMMPQSQAAPLSIHDPCSTRYETSIQDAVRNILKKQGRIVEELELNREKTECCSYGGLMWLANKAVAKKMVEQRIQEGPRDYVTYCAMCRDLYTRQGKRSLHLLDIIFGKDEEYPAGVPPMGYSQRHENRARLKWKLLKERWSEAMPEQAAFEAIRLILPAEVQKQVDDRLILVEDMQKVIEVAERSGKRMLNKTTGHYLAYYKPTAVTYWVEYTPQGDAFLIHRAYSHRMEIGTGAKR